MTQAFKIKNETKRTKRYKEKKELEFQNERLIVA